MPKELDAVREFRKWTHAPATETCRRCDSSRGWTRTSLRATRNLLKVVQSEKGYLPFDRARLGIEIDEGTKSWPKSASMNPIANLRQPTTAAGGLVMLCSAGADSENRFQCHSDAQRRWLSATRLHTIARARNRRALWSIPNARKSLPAVRGDCSLP